MTQARLAKIRLLLLDVDGVLTRGDIVYDDDGRQIKTFNVKDGVGIRLMFKAGLAVGIVTGRASAALQHRCRNLGLEMVFEAVRDKAAVLDEIIGQTGLTAEQIAFVGDDLPDLSIMKRVGLGVAVADAVAVVRRNAHWITQAPGGCGAVREVCEAILEAQGLMAGILESFGADR